MSKFKEFDTANDAFIARMREIAPKLKELEAEQERVENLGREADIKISGIKAAVPQLTYRITWPDGLEPPEAPVEG